MVSSGHSVRSDWAAVVIIALGGKETIEDDTVVNSPHALRVCWISGANTWSQTQCTF